MNLQKTLLLALIVFITNNLFSQQFFPTFEPVYIDTEVPRIDIIIDADSLIEIYLYENLESDHEYPATFIFTSSQITDTMELVGFRLRGNTSRYSEKKSFKISFNTFQRADEFYDLDKMNLNGEHNDPSIIRSKLCGDILHDLHVPASRTNHVEVYINDNYYGLYMSVEHIDDNFLEKRFSRDGGNLYKCYWGASLQYIGTDPNIYKFTSEGRRVYELKTNEDEDNYSDLAEFIDVLNNTPIGDYPQNLEPIFNVNLYLKTLAFEVLTAHWDGYAYNQNNYYLYKNPATGRFVYIPYDLDNTFGIDWFSIDWSTRDIYNWAAGNKPLANKLLQNSEYLKRFSFYVNLIIEEAMETSTFFPKIDAFETMITPSAEADLYRTLDYGFSIDDFHNSYIEEIGMHVPIGLKPYISNRVSSAENQLNLQSISPLVSLIDFGHLEQNKTFESEIFVEDDGTITSATFHYRLDNGEWNILAMNDEGLSSDTLAGDNVYSVSTDILTDVYLIDFYYEIEDNEGNTTREPFVDFFSVSRPLSSDYPLVINEFMANNDNIVADESGEYEDWIEIYNNSNNSVNLSNIYLTDNLLDFGKWRLPDMNLEAYGFLLIWADSDENDGNNHASFKLSKDGEQIGIFLKNGDEYLVIDSLTFGVQQNNLSYGCATDASEEFRFFTNPTPGFTNNYSFVYENEKADNHLIIYPNPVNDILKMKIDSKITDVQIFDSKGQKDNLYFDDYSNSINVSDLCSGVYFLNILVEKDSKTTNFQSKFIKY